MTWLADSVQSVLFLSPGGAYPDAAQVFEKVLGRASDSYQRATGAGPLANSVAQGVDGDTLFTVNSQAARIELFLQGKPRPDAPPEELSDPVAALASAIEKWRPLVDAYPLYRVSIVLNLVCIVDADDEILTVLREVLPSVPVEGEGVDFMYATNVRRAFGAEPSIEMNRIRRFGGARQQYLMVQAGPFAPSSPFQVSERLIATCTIDVNTAPTSEAAFSRDLAAKLYDELASEALKLLSEN